MQKLFQAGNLICYHKSTARCSIYISFPLSTSTHIDQIHLLEHMMIGDFIKTHTETKKHEGVIETLNGISNGFSLTFFATSHFKLARQNAVMMVDFLGHEPVLSQEEVDDEQLIIDAEEQHYIKSDIDRFNDLFDKHPATSDTANHDYHSYVQLHTLIQTSKPIIVLQGDFEQSEVIAAYTYLKHHLKVIRDNGSGEDLNFVDYSNISLREYHPTRDRFAGEYLKKVGLFLSTPLSIVKSISSQWLMTFFVHRCLLEFVRYQEKSDYGVNCTPRMLPDVIQSSWTFLSTSSSKDILILVGDMFGKTAQEFETIKNQISYDILQREDDHYQTYFALIQHILIAKGPRTIEDLANKLMNISYENFCSFYQENVEYFSIRELERFD
jgi:hypothetical protein